MASFVILGQIDISDPDSRRASSRGLIPRAKIKSVKMTFVIVFGKTHTLLLLVPFKMALRQI